MHKLYSDTMMKGHGIYPTGDSHEQSRHSWFSKSRAAPTAPKNRLGLGMGSTFGRGYSGTTFTIKSDSAWALLNRSRKLPYNTIKHKSLKKIL